MRRKMNTSSTSIQLLVLDKENYNLIMTRIPCFDKLKTLNQDTATFRHIIYYTD